MKIKKSYFKRISCFLFALALAFVVPFGYFNSKSNASAKTIISNVGDSVTIKFEPFNVMSSMKAPSTWGGTGAVIPIQYSLSVFCEPSIAEDGTDYSRFSLALNGEYGYFTQNYTSYQFTNKLFLDKSLTDGFDKAYVDQFLDNENYGYYELPNNGIEMYGWKSVYGFVPSNVWYQLTFNYDFDNALLTDTWTSYNETANVQNQFAVPFIYYLHTTNVNDTGFDWSSVYYMRHTRTAPSHKTYEIGEVEDQDVYQSVSFNSYDIYDFCKTDDVFFRFVFPSYNNNLPQVQDIYYFSTTDYDNGYRDGLKAGENTANFEQYETGFKVGKAQGESIGYDRGYTAGYNDSMGFVGLISAVIDVPIRSITSMLNFEVLGVNLSSFVFSLLTVCIVIAVIRWFN